VKETTDNDGVDNDGLCCGDCSSSRDTTDVGESMMTVSQQTSAADGASLTVTAC